MSSYLATTARRCALLTIALVALACAPAQAATRCPGANSVPLPTVTEADIAALACVVNRERLQRGLPALDRTRSLDHASARHSADMARRNYFDHPSPGGSTPAARARSAGYIGHARSWTVGETLAWGTGRLATPDSIVRAWLNSPPHRELMLSPRFADFGLGTAAGAPQPGVSGGATYTMMLGRRSG